MAKIGENVSVLIDKTVDFMASSQAFREYLNKTPPRNVVPAGKRAAVSATSGVLSAAVSTAAGREISKHRLIFERLFLS